MATTPPSPQVPVAPPSTPPPAGALPAKKSRWLLYGCGTLVALVLLVVATVLLTLWWVQRPIKPVVLSAREKAAVEAKLQRLGSGSPPAPAPNRPAAPNPTAEAAEPPRDVAPPPIANQELDRPYVPGSKVLKLTEREINGLLNANTDLGNAVRLEFAQDAINAYVAVPIPKDFPVGGGKMFRARARFSVSVGNGGAPYAILEDVTVFGLSLPKAWLGGLKGENLLGDAIGSGKGGSGLKGIKRLRVEPGALVLEVED